MGGTERCRIEFGLAAKESERLIAKAIGVCLSAVSRKIRKHTCVSFKGCYGRANQCVRRADCRLTGVCGDCENRFTGLTGFRSSNLKFKLEKSQESYFGGRLLINSHPVIHFHYFSCDMNHPATLLLAIIMVRIGTTPQK